MDDLIEKSLSSINNANNINSIKFSFKLFLEGLKDVSFENSNLKKEIETYRQKIRVLESRLETLQGENVDITNAINSNSTAINNLETSLPKNNDPSASASLPLDDSAKDTKITQLEQKIVSLERKIDATEAYERRDSIIISGAVPPSTQGREENSAAVAIDIIKKKLPSIEIEPKDISVAHRLQSKPAANGSTPRPPNLYVKLVRRDLKKQLIAASKGQAKNADRIFINDSLTPQRTAIFRTLQRIRRDHDIIKGVSSMEGEVFAYTAAPNVQGARDRNSRPPKDLRHRINSKDQLRTFCNEYVKKALEDFVVTWPSM